MRRVPRSARWFNRIDPFAGFNSDPLSLHKYLYASGDPIGVVDPTGLFGIAGVAVSASIGANLQGLKVESDLFAFDLAENLLDGIQRQQTVLQVLAKFGIGQGIGLGLFGAVGIWSRFAPITGIAGTRGLRHSFDRHAAEWFARHGGTPSLAKWQDLLETASRSSKVVDWSTGADKTIGHLARIDGHKWFFVQFFKQGPRAGEVATAFIPNKDQLRAILELLEK